MDRRLDIVSIVYQRLALKGIDPSCGRPYQRGFQICKFGTDEPEKKIPWRYIIAAERFILLSSKDPEFMARPTHPFFCG
jgi:hypothetical protein